MGYGSYTYSITVFREGGSEERTVIYEDENRPLAEGERIHIAMFGDIKITKIVEQPKVGRASKAHAVKVVESA